MKKLFLLFTTALLGLMAGCTYDDGAIWDKFDEMEKEHSEMQEQIDAQQALINALANNLTITNITQIENGYTITFSDGSTATIKDGEKGDKGDSFFHSITWDDENVYFTLDDGSTLTLSLVPTTPPTNEIWYTSTDSNIVKPNLGVTIVSNIYRNGRGVITASSDITSIKKDAFSSCSSLESIIIPDSVTSIGESAFEYCYNLKSITIPDSVTSVGEYAFSDCSNLESITIPDGVISIEEYTFLYCWNLTSVTIGKGVTSIGYEAFYGCSNLTEVYCKPTTPPMGNYDMFEHNASMQIYVPTESVEAYKAADGWRSYAYYIVGYDFE